MIERARADGDLVRVRVRVRVMVRVRARVRGLASPNRVGLASPTLSLTVSGVELGSGEVNWPKLASECIIAPCSGGGGTGYG